MWRGSIGDYGSHYPVLAAAVVRALQRYPGPVLELGAGDWSTPMLHYMCREAGRVLVTLDSDAAWVQRFKEYDGPWHQIQIVTDWPKALDFIRHSWSLAFVDNAPGEMRRPAIEALKGNAALILAHDSERDHDTGANYEYEKVRPLFKHVTEFRRFRPYTLALSDDAPFEIEEVDKSWTPPAKS